MLERIENVNEQVIEKMFLLYAESMADMEGNLKIVMKWRHHMRRF